MYYKFFTNNGYFSQTEAIAIAASRLKLNISTKTVYSKYSNQVAAAQIMHKNHFNQVRQKVKNHQP